MKINKMPKFDRYQITVYDFYDPEKSDSEIIADAFSYAALFEERTLIFDQKDWNIDEAVQIPSNTKVMIDGCMIKQNNEVFDNVFRGDNVTIDENDPYGHPLRIDRIQNIVIEGKNGASIVGCDVNKRGYHPVLQEEHDMTTDYWGWRTLQICFSFAENVEISGLTFKQTRCWAISFDKCAWFDVHHIHMESSVRNGDGVNARAGCHDFTISHITGYTSDDTVAMTAVRRDDITYPWKNYLYTMEPSRFLNPNYDDREMDIYNGSISNIETDGNCNGVICAVGDYLRIYNIQIDRVIEPVDRKGSRGATVKLFNGHNKNKYRDNDIYNIRVNNVVSNVGKYAIKADFKVKNVWFNKIVQQNRDHKLSYIADQDGITITNS